MTLFLLKTEGCGDFYVVSQDMQSAAEKLTNILYKEDYRSVADREIKSIKVVSHEANRNEHSGKLNFYVGFKFIL